MFGSRDNMGPRKIKGLFTAETTSSKEPEDVLQEVEQVMKKDGYETRVNKYAMHLYQLGSFCVMLSLTYRFATWLCFARLDHKPV